MNSLSTYGFPLWYQGDIHLNLNSKLLEWCGNGNVITGSLSHDADLHPIQKIKML